MCYGSIQKNNIISFTSEVLNDPNSISKTEKLITGFILNVNTIEKFNKYSTNISLDTLLDTLLETTFDKDFGMICYCDFKNNIYDYVIYFNNKIGSNKIGSNKIGPNKINLSKFMDPKELSNESANLNLQLIL